MQYGVVSATPIPLIDARILGQMSGVDAGASINTLRICNGREVGDFPALCAIQNL